MRADFQTAHPGPGLGAAALCAAVNRDLAVWGALGRLREPARQTTPERCEGRAVSDVRKSMTEAGLLIHPK